MNRDEWEYFCGCSFTVFLIFSCVIAHFQAKEDEKHNYYQQELDKAYLKKINKYFGRDDELR